MTDFVVEFHDAGEGSIGDQETFVHTNLWKLLHLLSTRLHHDKTLADCCGLTIQAVDDSD